jgi:hypothetical protein
MKRMMLIAAMLLFALEATAQVSKAPAPSKAPKEAGALSGRTGYFELGLAGGYMFNPDMPAGMVDINYYLTDEISVGPYFHFGGGGQNHYWGVAGQIRYAPELAANAKARPYGTLGIGFINTSFENTDHPKGITYFFPIGGGLEFEVNDILSLDIGGIFAISQDSFTGLTVGLKAIL